MIFFVLRSQSWHITRAKTLHTKITTLGDKTQIWKSTRLQQTKTWCLRNLFRLDLRFSFLGTGSFNADLDFWPCLIDSLTLTRKKLPALNDVKFGWPKCQWEAKWDRRCRDCWRKIYIHYLRWFRKHWWWIFPYFTVLSTMNKKCGFFPRNKIWPKNPTWPHWPRFSK